MKVKVLIKKTDAPKGGYCGCASCKAGLTYLTKYDGFTVDGIIPCSYERWFLSTRRKSGMIYSLFEHFNNRTETFGELKYKSVI